MSDHEGRREDALIETAMCARRRKAIRINTELRATASIMDTPPEYVCEGCARYIEFCKCEDDAE